MPAYRLQPIEAPWGDFGHILYQGMAMRLERANGKLQLERTGPEIFPITFPGPGLVVVTDDCRRAFGRSGLGGVQFRAVVKARIVELDWGAWDVAEEDAPETPDSGEPEGYLLDRPHSPEAAATMPNLWELVLTEDPAADLRHLPATLIVAASPKARAWFERYYGDYVSFQKEP